MTASSTSRQEFKLLAAGHAANGVAVMYQQEREVGDTRPSLILKPLDKGELKTYESLEGEFVTDPISKWVPGFHGVEEAAENERYLLLDNLTHGFSQPRVMDVKLGLRTFCEADCQNAKPRADLFKKMSEDFPESLSPEEIQAQAVTKLRYMTARDMKSTSGTLGYRLSGTAGCYAGPSPASGYRALISESSEAACQAFRSFARQASITVPVQYTEEDNQLRSSAVAVASNFVEELCRLRSAMEKSSFVQHHECIGTSVLLIVDATGRFGVWWIDFAKTRACAAIEGLSHRQPPAKGSQEDGLLTGLDNLIAAWDLVARGFDEEDKVFEEEPHGDKLNEATNPCCRLLSRFLGDSLYPWGKIWPGTPFLTCSVSGQCSSESPSS